MIAACPKCQTRYRVEPGKLGADGARLRCSHCNAVFRVRLPADAPAAAHAPAAATALSEPGTESLRAGNGLARDLSVAGGVARSEPSPSGDPERVRPTPVTQPAAAELRSAPQDAPSRSQHGDSGVGNAAPADAAPHFDHARLVLLAHPNPDACKRVAEALEREGLQVLVAHDGVEAILTVQRALPRAVVLDAALPKMFGFQVCELIKRNESLRVMQVCLIGAIHREDRYRRAPNEIYGADFYIESPSLPGALIEWLGRIGFDLRGKGPATPTPASVEALREPLRSEPPLAAKAPASDAAPRAIPRSEPEPEPIEAEKSRLAAGVQPGTTEGRPGPIPPRAAPETPASAKAIGRIGVSADPLAAERAQAERLARIIVSDIVLYNEEKFGAAVRNGGVLETMRDELAEGRALFRERIDVQVRDERDFLGDELMRVARSRGAS